MNMILDWDEWYPVYVLTEDPDQRYLDDRYSVEVSQELWNEYNAAWQAFNDVQRKLEQMRWEIER